MKKRILLVLSVLMIVLQSCERNEDFGQLEPQGGNEEVLSKDQLNQVIFDILKETKEFGWKDLNDDQLVSAFLLSDKVVTVAWDYNSTNNEEKNAIIDLIYESEKESADKEEIILDVDDDLKILDARIEKVETLLALRHFEKTVSLDVYYEIFTTEEIEGAIREYESSMTANSDQDIDNRNSAMEPVTKDVAKNHNIPAAWAAGLTGSGIKVAVIDGGLLKDDKVFGANGNADGNNPNPRSVEKKGFYKSKWWNPFASFDGPYAKSSFTAQHGTIMMNIIGGPSGPATGVAFNADLISVRSANLVYIDLFPNVRGVTRAFNDLAGRSEVKVISMSQGGLIRWTAIERAIKRCHDKGKMIFTAGGTFLLAPLITTLIAGSPANITLFPARLSTVHSVTGIRNAVNIDHAYWCPSCFGKADFVAEFDSGGASSEATANTAGMAALIWAREPDLSRSEVFEKIKSASDRAVAKHPYFGHGRINMQTYLDNEGL